MEDIKNLINILNYHTDLYNKGKEIISDEEWDKLYFTLKKEEEKTGIIYPNSPTQSIHYTTVSQLNKVTHNHSMLSLNKTKSIDEINSFLHGEPFVAMFKMDGLTCSLTYENGQLISAETRGNGIVGEDILHNAKVIKNIPQEIPYTGYLVVDGEIICRKDDFVPFQKDYKNPRNFASGSIRLLSAEECAKRNLTFIAWEMIEGYSEIKELWERLVKLEDLGFTIVPMVPDRQWVDEALEVLQENFKDAHAIYPIDGYVFKFNDVEYGKKQGQTDHHLKNAIAYKLYDETYETHLKYIDWTMGRTGVLTPVAVFDPIDIDGSTVERASLHNVSVMREILGNCAYVGESLQIIKANQIIPQVMEAGPHYDYDYVIANGGVPANDNPEYCPICGQPISYTTNNDVINAYCNNSACEGKLINKINHFCSKKGLDIKGLSEKTIEKIIDWGFIETTFDIFNLHSHQEEWISKPGFGKASVFKILQAIEEKQNYCSLAAFLSAISIPLIGQTAAKDLCKYFETYSDFRDAVMDDSFNFAQFNNFGEEMHSSIKNFDYSEADKIANILNFEPIMSKKEINNILEGKTFVITGKLVNFKNRNELKDIIINYGGRVTNSVTSKTDYLINNDINSDSSKNQTAKRLNIPIVTEEQFKDFLK